MNSSCFIICELNWIVFMAIVKHFRVKMRLASFCCANLIKYKFYILPREFVILVNQQWVRKSLQREWRFSASFNKICSHGAQEGNVNWMNKTGDDDLES